MELSGISFFDLLGKLVPGFLIWTPWILKTYYKNPSEFLLNESIIPIWIFIILIGAYLTGIIWQFLIQIITKRIRLLPCMLRKAQIEYYRHSGNSNNVTSDLYIVREYVKAYYKGLNNGILRDLPVLESHENFLKTIWLIILYDIITTILIDINIDYDWRYRKAILIFLVIVFFFIPFIWYNIQMKIYYLVWEAKESV